MTKSRLSKPRILAVVAASVLAAPVLAQSGGGMNLQQPVPPQPLPSEPGLVIPAPNAASPAAAPAASSATTTTLRSVRIEGNTLIDTPSLLAAIGPVQGKQFDLAGLQALAQSVARVYRERGYPFTAAVLPEQRLGTGDLTIEVIEGVYGRVKITGSDPLAPQAQSYVDTLLVAGEPIAADRLERATLLLNDQPGFAVQPLIRPGSNRGEGDLDIALSRRNFVSGEVALDNAGSRATGEARARGVLNFNSPFVFGDRVSLSVLVTDKSMWLGSAEYERPFGGSGLRGSVSAARTSYQLVDAFSSLDAQGSADVFSARLSYPFVRAQLANLLGSVSLQHKKLHDDFAGGTVVRDKKSDLVVAALQFDRRDSVLGGGVTYGLASLTAGRLGLDSASEAIDAQTARTSGSFAKFNVDLARIQNLGGAWSLYGRISAQAANKNLDSSEKLGLGGFFGVRAYPLGEASGDTGWLGQVELRWAAADSLTVFALADGGRIRTNQEPWSSASQSHRAIAGAGFGVRWNYDRWSLEALASQRLHGGAPTSDPSDRRPRVFAVLSYRFN